MNKNWKKQLQNKNKVSNHKQLIEKLEAYGLDPESSIFC